MNLYDNTGTQIALSREAGRGGEAIIYRVYGRPDLLAKVYTPGPHPGYEVKLAWMRDHPPVEPEPYEEHHSFAWPLDLLFDGQGQLAGYLMARIRGAASILEVFNPRLRVRTLPFNRLYLHRTGRNLAACLAALHAEGYVAGDLSESNVLVTPQAMVSFIDTDSFQVQVPEGTGTRVFPCPVGRPEYTAPELHGQTLSEVIRRPEHDSFALAVLTFQLLMEGNHPFRSLWRGEGEPPPLEERVGLGLFPHLVPPPRDAAPPPNVAPLDVLHPHLVELLERCFVDGYLDPGQRPSAAEWRDRLEEAESTLVKCRRGHYHAGHLETCPTCRSRASRPPARPRPIPDRYATTPPAVRSPAPTAQRPRQVRPARTNWSQAAPTTAPAPAGDRPQRALRSRNGRLALVLGGLSLLLAIVGSALLPRYRQGATAPSLPTATTGPPVTPLASTSPPPVPTLTPSPEGTPATATEPPFFQPHLPPLLQPAGAITPGNVGQIAPLVPVGFGQASHVSWSPDGRFLVVGSSQGATFYTTDFWTLAGFWESPSEPIGLAPDGSLLATGVEDGSLQLWYTATGDRLSTLPGHSGRTLTALFSPDNKWLVISLLEDTATIWRIDTGEQTDVTTRNALALSPDGRLLAGRPGPFDETPDGSLLASRSNRAIHVWNVTSGSRVATLTDYTTNVTDVAFSPDGTLVASGAGDGTVQIWDGTTGRCRRTLGERGSRVTAVTFSPDGTALAAATELGLIRIWRTSDGKERQTLSTAPSAIDDVVFSPDGSLLACAAKGDKAILWHVATGRRLRVLAEEQRNVTSLAFSPQGDLLVTGGIDDRQVRAWTVATGAEAQDPFEHAGSVTSLAFSPPGDLLAVGDSEGGITLWDTETGQAARRLVGHRHDVTGLSFSPDGRVLASRGRDGQMRLWGVNTGRDLASVTPPAVTSLDFSPDGTLLAIGTKDSAISLWGVPGAPIPRAWAPLLATPHHTVK